MTDSKARWFGVGIVGNRLVVGCCLLPRTFAPEVRCNMPRVNEDEAERKRAEALRASDPRLQNRNHRPRMSMLEEERPRSTGAELEEFIDPDNPTPRQRRLLRHRRRYGDG